MSRRRRGQLGTALVGIATAALLACACAPRGGHATPLVWRDVGKGITYATVNVTAAETPFTVHAFDVDLALVDVKVQSAGKDGDRAPVSALAQPFPQHVAVNGSFFDPDGKVLGRVANAGAVVAGARRTTWGAFIVDAPNARVVLGSSLPEGEAGGLVVLQGLPRLVVDGKPTKLKPQTAARTAVCAGGARAVVVVTTPAQALDLAELLARPRDRGGLGCTDALNLDGGPSTQASVRLPGLNLDVPGGWGVPNALVFVPRTPLEAAPPTPTPAPATGP